MLDFIGVAFSFTPPSSPRALLDLNCEYQISVGNGSQLWMIYIYICIYIYIYLQIDDREIADQTL